MSSTYYTYTNNNPTPQQTNTKKQSSETAPRASTPTAENKTGKSYPFSAEAEASSAAIPTNAYIVEDSQSASTPTGKLGNAVSIVAGGAIALVGVPMLVLPGPGLLAIGGGVALMAKGAKGLLGTKKK